MIDLRCGDVIAELSKIPDGSVGLCLFSPPYNVMKVYDGHSDEVPWPAWYSWMAHVISHAYRVLEKGGTLAINVPTVVRWQRQHKYADSWSLYDPLYSNHQDGVKVLGKARMEPVAFRLFAMMEAEDKHTREPIIWVKGRMEGEAIANNYQMGCDSDPYLRGAHEMILLGSKVQWFHRGGTGRRGPDVMPDLDACKDVWFVPGESNSKHPAPFPVEIARRLIKLFIHDKDALVLDPFCGIGSSGIAALELGCNFIGIDLSQRYLDIAQDRITTVLSPQLALPLS